MISHAALRIACVAALPFVVALWLSIPAFQPALQTASGPVERARACLVVCADVVTVAGKTLACGTDFLGVPYACDDRLLEPGDASVAYVRLPSLASLGGFAPVAGTLTRLERDGRPVHVRSVSAQVWTAMYGGWVFNAVYWSLAGSIVWLWPRSKFARRTTWSDAP